MVLSVTQAQTTVDYLLIDQAAAVTDLTNNPTARTPQFTRKRFALNPVTGVVTPINAYLLDWEIWWVVARTQRVLAAFFML